VKISGGRKVNKYDIAIIDESSLSEEEEGEAAPF